MVSVANAAESNRASLRWIQEVTWGTTPTSGATQELRITSSGLTASKDTKISEEIRADRMVPQVIEVGAATAGKVSGEFSAGTWDPFFQAFVCGSWSQAMNYFQVKGRSVAITDTDEITITGKDWTGWLTTGRWLKLEGFTTPTNNDYVSIASASYTGGNTVITVDQTTLTAESGSAYTKVLDANDVILVSTSVTFEASNVIDGGTNAFQNKGLKVGQRIYVEGLGKESGTVLSNATDPTEGATITVSDGTDSVVFEVRTNAALIGNNSVHVALSGTPATMATNLANAINAQFAKGALRCSATVSTATVTITNHRLSGGSISTSDATAFTVTNFSGGSATKGGFYTIAALPDNDTIQVEETLSTDTNATNKTVVIKGSHLRNSGVLTEIDKQSFTMETGFNDIEKYFVHNGLRVASFSMKVEAGEIVGIEFDFRGKETTSRTSTLLGDTGDYDVLESTSTEIFNATANAGTVKKDGSVLTDIAIRSIDIEGDASLRDQKAVASKFPAGIGTGRFSLTGKLVSYFSGLEFYNDFINHETTSVGFDFEDVDHNVYEFRIPALKITSDPIAPGGIDQDVMEEMDYVAQREPTLNTQFMIDRFSSTYPMSAA